MKTLGTSFFALLVNLNKIKYFIFSHCYNDLGVGCSTKEATGNFFREHFSQNHENTICFNFQFYNPKLSQERCFMLCVCSIGLCNRCFTKEAMIASFVEQFKLNIENKRCLEFQFHLAKFSQ